MRPRRQIGLAATVVASGFVGLVVTSLIGLYMIRHTLAALTDLYNIDDLAARNARAALMISLELTAGIGAAALVSMFVAVVLLSHRIYGPMVAFDHHLKKLIAGDFGARVKLREKDEFDDLAQTLNALAESLQSRFPGAR